MSRPALSDVSVVIAANNGDVGGGEVMLVRIAQACRAQQIAVSIVAPRFPGGVATAAQQAGFPPIVLPADDRVSWMRALRRWDRRRRNGILWCNGLVPALATAGHADRIVHLHQAPAGLQRAAARLARWHALDVLVPSQSMRESVPHARVMPNWTAEFPMRERHDGGGTFRIGFLGRLSVAKGVPVLAEAVRRLEATAPGRYRLVIGGEPMFVSSAQRAAVDDALGGISASVDRRGWVQPMSLFDDIDLLVVPSVAHESFGLVAAEAMAARVPVIVSDVGALPEVVGDGYPLIVPAGDPVLLADMIADVAEHRLAPDTDASYRRWQEQFSPRAGTARVADVLRAAASRAKRAFGPTL